MAELNSSSVSTESTSLVNVSILSEPAEECEFCKLGMDHFCLPLAEFQRIGLVNKSQDFRIYELSSDESEDELPIAEFANMGLAHNDNNFKFYNQSPLSEQSSEDELIIYSEEGPEETEEANLSIIDDLEDSIGYQTRQLETPPRQPIARRRSSTPDVNRRRSLTFDQFIENLVDANEDFPGIDIGPVGDALDLDSIEVSALDVDEDMEF